MHTCTRIVYMYTYIHTSAPVPIVNTQEHHSLYTKYLSGSTRYAAAPPSTATHRYSMAHTHMHTNMHAYIPVRLSWVPCRCDNCNVDPCFVFDQKKSVAVRMAIDMHTKKLMDQRHAQRQQNEHRRTQTYERHALVRVANKNKK
jgi:hypothetical protein